MNIVLIGFRCSGKTVIGKRLASRLNYEFIDIDEEVEKYTKNKIHHILQTRGEEYLRNREAEVVARLCKSNGKVIATGGGIVTRRKNMHNLKRTGILIFLETDAKNIIRRLMSDENREIRQPKPFYPDWQTEIEEQLKLRRPYYLSVADFIINTNNKTIDEVVEETFELVKREVFRDIDI